MSGNLWQQPWAASAVPSVLCQIGTGRHAGGWLVVAAAVRPKVSAAARQMVQPADRRDCPCSFGSAVSRRSWQFTACLSGRRARQVPAHRGVLARWCEHADLDDRAASCAKFFVEQFRRPAPSNFFPTNPEGHRRAVETKGESVKHGMENGPRHRGRATSR